MQLFYFLRLLAKHIYMKFSFIIKLKFYSCSLLQQYIWRFVCVCLCACAFHRYTVAPSIFHSALCVWQVPKKFLKKCTHKYYNKTCVWLAIFSWMSLLIKFLLLAMWHHMFGAIHAAHHCLHDIMNSWPNASAKNLKSKITGKKNSYIHTILWQLSN